MAIAAAMKGNINCNSGNSSKISCSNINTGNNTTITNKVVCSVLPSSSNVKKCNILGSDSKGKCFNLFLHFPLIIKMKW